MKEVVDMIKEIGVTEARWKWCRQGGSQQIFKNALSEYNFQITAERQKNMIDKAKHIIWKDWQQFVVNYLMAPVNNREILVVLDKNGNSGKTFLMKNFQILNAEKTCNITNGKVGDMMYIISKKPLVENILVNLPRSVHSTINYQLLEQAKDGEICSTKYDGREVNIDYCRMVVFTNHPLSWEALTKDRWLIMTIKKGGMFKVENYTDYKAMGGEGPIT